MFTPIEMASQYRQCKNKQDQIKAFMELEQLSEDAVIEILKSQGITAQQLPRKKVSTSKPAAPKSVAASTSTDLRETVSVTSAEAAIDNFKQHLIKLIQHEIDCNTAVYRRGESNNADFAFGLNSGLSLAMSLILFSCNKDEV